MAFWQFSKNLYFRNFLIPYSKQSINKSDLRAVLKTIKSHLLTKGPEAEKFENNINKYCKSKYCSVLNSASSALQAACFAILKNKKNKLVWTTANSFVATSNCIINLGHKVDFIDIDKFTYNISINKLEEKLEFSKKINQLPDVLIVVHIGGSPVDLEKIKNLSKKYKFKIIEDASHAMGSIFNNQKIGSCKYSDITVFSFHPVKMITTCEGGAITTNNKSYIETIRSYKENGIYRDRKYHHNHNENLFYYEQHHEGFNMRLNEVSCSLGNSQLLRLNKFVLLRNQKADYYKNNLKDEDIFFQIILPNCTSSYHLFVINLYNFKIDTRNKIIKALYKKKFLSNIHYIPIPYHPFYRKLGFNPLDYPNSLEYYNKSLSIPLFPDLKKTQQDQICRIIKTTLKL